MGALNLICVWLNFLFVYFQIERKDRVHFHSFMTNVHAKIHEVKKQMPPREIGSEQSCPFDPIKPVANSIAESSWLICFDEFQVNFIFLFLVLIKNRSNNFFIILGNGYS